MISIHVPCVGDDQIIVLRRISAEGISIHVPRVGDDISRLTVSQALSYFNPRPLCGGRRTAPSKPCRHTYFNPRPPCGGRLTVVPAAVGICAISIHVPRVGDDHIQQDLSRGFSPFQSTSPVWGTTCGCFIVGLLRLQFQSTSPVWGTTVFKRQDLLYR